MRFFVFLTVVFMLGCFSNNVFADDFNLDSPRNKGKWRFEIDNDAFLGEDSNFSNGWSIQYHTQSYSSWEESNAFGWVKWIGQHFPTLGDEESIVRYGQGVGQNLVTPEDITNPNPPPGDLPYAASLTYTLNWQRFNPETASNFQVSIGVLGEEALGEEVQKFVHDDLGAGDTPEGWDTQRDTEPVLNIGYQHLWRVLQFGEYNNAWGSQLIFAPSLHLGNIFTSAEVGFAFRFGWNILEGFNAYPAPPGRGFFQSSHLAKPASASPHAIEFILAGRASALGYSVIYDGSEISDDDREIEREDYILGGYFAINYHHYDMLGIRLSILVQSDVLDEDALPPPLPNQDPTSNDNSYGTIMIDFYF